MLYSEDQQLLQETSTESEMSTVLVATHGNTSGLSNHSQFVFQSQLNNSVPASSQFNVPKISQYNVTQPHCEGSQSNAFLPQHQYNSQSNRNSNKDRGRGYRGFPVLQSGQNGTGYRGVQPVFQQPMFSANTFGYGNTGSSFTGTSGSPVSQAQAETEFPYTQLMTVAGSSNSVHVSPTTFHVPLTSFPEIQIPVSNVLSSTLTASLQPVSLNENDTLPNPSACLSSSNVPAPDENRMTVEPSFPSLVSHSVSLPVSSSHAMAEEYAALVKQNTWTLVSPPSQDCSEKLKNSLFMVGEIGGNDYGYALLQGKSIDEVKTIVPEVVGAITDAVKKVIDFGAARVVVPGNFPVGCFPIYLTAFQTNNSYAYDFHHCLEDLNRFSKHHNHKLKKAIRELQIEYPTVAIVYGDYYHAFQWLFLNARFLGFNGESQKACCGTGGDYNFSLTKTCGAPQVSICQNPSEFISWDGHHLTEEAYKWMAGWFINDIFPKLHC
ncbi:hypothetical protein Vadar_032551 [Vaccinium darrowii]|uniref:Uncharacterized protein n=1 Tax=Vaccinium darrowii TaxID=229202 RepID=A0ACB7Y482_9ERIC|nr:hypothetical protein Vadar_032551 [Vaccinium darrowii]